jgi:hypothetical protein
VGFTLTLIPKWGCDIYWASKSIAQFIFTIKKLARKKPRKVY